MKQLYNISVKLAKTLYTYNKLKLFIFIGCYRFAAQSITIQCADENNSNKKKVL
jgi:hypothetical protein